MVAARMCSRNKSAADVIVCVRVCVCALELLIS